MNDYTLSLDRDLQQLYATDLCHELARYVYELYPDNVKIVELSCLDNTGHRQGVHWFLWLQRQNKYLDAYGVRDSPYEIKDSFAPIDPSLFPRFHVRRFKKFIKRSTEMRQKGGYKPYSGPWRVDAEKAFNELKLEPFILA